VKGGRGVTASGYGIQPAHDLLVRRCGTELEIDSTPGRASVLRAYLPFAPSAA